MELAYHRRGLFALELIDAVSMERVTQGVTIDAKGLRGRPFVNSSGLFVWNRDDGQDISQLEKLVIDPGQLPLEKVELTPNDLQLPLTTVVLSPRATYPSPIGLSGIRGRLIERQVLPPELPQPVVDAKVWLQWKDAVHGRWNDASTISSMDARTGEFLAILRLGAQAHPEITAGTLLVRLIVVRGIDQRMSPESRLTPGQTEEPSPANSRVFVWEDLDR